MSANLHEAAGEQLRRLELPENTHALVLLMRVDGDRDVELGSASNAPRPLVAFSTAVLADTLGGRLETPNAAEIADLLYQLIVGLADLDDEQTFAIFEALSPLGDLWGQRLVELIDRCTQRQAAKNAEAVAPDPLLQIEEQPAPDAKDGAS